MTDQGQGHGSNETHPQSVDGSGAVPSVVYGTGQG
jgi:hypothetical protein